VRLQKIGIFFDRDGTLNTEVDYLSKPEELQLIPNAARAIREANRAGLKVFVITNQSGIARGLFTEADLHRIHHHFENLLAEQGARIDKIFYCPHHPDYGIPPYRVLCSCRKPKTGMLEEAMKEFGIRLEDSFVIGDRCVDIKTGNNAGCGTILVRTGYGALELDECRKSARIDYVAHDAYDAWQYIHSRINQRMRQFRSTHRNEVP
jgi:D-glycero-D-manno-heptose 1,7-bisphosphate phosphatase